MPAILITDRVKQIVRMRGPVIPSQISKEIGTNILMASAILSELASSNHVMISSVKVGGTPLYYVAGQEAKLQNYLTSLHPKEKEAFEKLKSEGVIRDAGQDPATRVALRQIKDFAKAIEVNMDGTVELFWKWYLLDDAQAEQAVKKALGIAPEPPPSPAPPQQPIQPQQTVQPQKAEIPQQTLQDAIKPEAGSKKQPKPRGPTQAALEFSTSVKEFFSKNSISVESEGELAKSQAEFAVSLPSPVGSLRYYCIAQNKKSCTDADISSAIVQGQLRKLPVLLLTKGELTKKARELLSKDIAVVVKKI